MIPGVEGTDWLAKHAHDAPAGQMLATWREYGCASGLRQLVEAAQRGARVRLLPHPYQVDALLRARAAGLEDIVTSRVTISGWEARLAPARALLVVLGWASLALEADRALRQLSDAPRGLSGSEVARIACCSSRTLRRSLQSSPFGTLRRAMLQARLDVATFLLASEFSITETAHACGYTDSTSLARLVGGTTGMTTRCWQRLVESDPSLAAALMVAAMADGRMSESVRTDRGA